MRTLLLTSTFLRHLYVASIAAQRSTLVGLWREEKSFVPERHARNPDEAAIIGRHFAARDQAEAESFAGAVQFEFSSATVIRDVGPGSINEPEEIALMQGLRPDVVLVFGTGLLRSPLIDVFRDRIINIHLGLSPYYRGAGTNFWPLVNREPEYVGATIHFLDAGIDTGAIIAHVRPEMTPSDGPHEIGNRAIVAAADVLLDAAELVTRDKARGVPQRGKGRVYQRKDFTAAAVELMYRNFATGMIHEYLRTRSERDAAIELVTPECAA